MGFQFALDFYTFLLCYLTKVARLTSLFRNDWLLMRVVGYWKKYIKLNNNKVYVKKLLYPWVFSAIKHEKKGI